jgi:hypothetical protein
VGDFDIGTIISVGASTVIGNVRDFRGKWIDRIGVFLAAGILFVEGGIHDNVQEMYLFGYGRLVSLGPFAQVLKKIVADEEVRSAQTRYG